MIFRVRNTLTNQLLLILVALYIATFFYPGLEEKLFLFNRALLSDGKLHGVATGEWYRLFTAGFLHAGLTHLLFNLMALYTLGTPFEMIYGRIRYAILLFVSLFGGSLASVTFNAENQPSVGASGAIFGLFGALLVMRKALGADLRSTLALLGINAVIAIVIPGIDWRAHLGGLLAGALAALIFRVLPTKGSQNH